MRAIARRGAKACVQRVGSMITLFFTPGPVRSWDDAEAADTKAFAHWHGGLLARGIYWPPSQFEAAFLGAAHTEADIDATLKAAEEALYDRDPGSTGHGGTAARRRGGARRDRGVHGGGTARHGGGRAGARRGARGPTRRSGSCSVVGPTRPTTMGATMSHTALLDINRAFYEPLWARSRLVGPERFNTWPLVRALSASSGARLEVAPGLSPRLPITGTRFVDMSPAAVSKLVARGADATVGLVSGLPCADGAFELVGAFDIIEHVDDDERALAELARVTAPGGALLLSAPIHASRWTAFDDLVGHGRRYDPRALVTTLARHGWSIERSGPYGMQPRSGRLLDFVVWSFKHRRQRAIWWYTRVILPLGALFQKRLELSPGMIEAERVDEVLLVCRRQGAPGVEARAARP